jgi:hypothetical protein
MPIEKLIADALAHGLWTYSWILALLSAIVAGAGAGLGAYLKKTGELRALNCSGFMIAEAEQCFLRVSASASRPMGWVRGSIGSTRITEQTDG